MNESRVLRVIQYTRPVQEELQKNRLTVVCEFRSSLLADRQTVLGEQDARELNERIPVLFDYERIVLAHNTGVREDLVDRIEAIGFVVKVLQRYIFVVRFFLSIKRIILYLSIRKGGVIPLKLISLKWINF